jgi:hypothetical protein
MSWDGHRTCVPFSSLIWGTVYRECTEPSVLGYHRRLAPPVHSRNFYASCRTNATRISRIVSNGFSSKIIRSTSHLETRGDIHDQAHVAGLT